MGLVCRRCGISRPTLRKWLTRYQKDSVDGLLSQSVSSNHMNGAGSIFSVVRTSKCSPIYRDDLVISKRMHNKALMKTLRLNRLYDANNQSYHQRARHLKTSNEVQTIHDDQECTHVYQTTPLRLQ